MSTIDLRKFHQAFFDESLEGLSSMESDLLDLNPDDIDLECINSIFRAAHSIKGGSGTFGFSAVADFTHVLETLLNEVREGERGIDQNVIDLLLQSVDCLRGMIIALRDDQEQDVALAQQLKEEFERILGTSSEPNDEEAGPAASSDKVSQWRIEFKPHQNMLLTGNEPRRIIREVLELGELDIEVKFDKVPDFTLIEPESCYLYWTLTLTADVERSALEEIFEWVEGDCDLSIEPVEAKSEAASDAQGINIDMDGDGENAVAETGAPKQAQGATKSAATASSESTSIRVATDKVDSLINLVGELVITQSMLGQIGNKFEMNMLHKLQEGLSQLEHNTRELQESVMSIRMLPISFVFNRFPRMIRDLGRQLDKKIELSIQGETTEVDKTVMEKLGDPMVHLVRNACDHGIEDPETRVAAGKPEMGTVSLDAYHQGGNVIIEIVDDGRGLDSEKILAKARENGLVKSDEHLTDDQINHLIFEPGFSTAEVVSDVSGRGVGMDVVKRNIQAMGGTVHIQSKQGEGSKITITLPLTLAILDGQLVRVGDHTYVVPLISIVESIQVSLESCSQIAAGCDVFKLRDQYVPIIHLHDIFGLKNTNDSLDGSLMVVADSGEETVGIIVDELLAQQQVVIKSVEANYKRVDGLSAATILGDGTVAFILDIPDLVRLAGCGHQLKNINLPINKGPCAA